MASSRLFWKLVLALAALNLILAPFLAEVARRSFDDGGSRPGVGVVFLLLLAGVGAIAGVVAWYLADRSWREVEQVIEAADRLGRGEPVPLLEANRKSDALPLTLAFQRMQRRLAQQFRRLGEENLRLSTVMDGMDEGVLALDGERRVVLANAASRHLLQTPAGAVIGRPLLEVVRSREIHLTVEEALRGDGVYEAEVEIAADPRRHLRVRAKRLMGDASPGVVIVVDDVSNLRRLENLRTEFAANVSHELKTPLASIKAYAETLRLGAVNDPDHNVEFVGRIEEHADRLHFLISDLMHLARVESGKEVFEIADFPLEDLVEECVDYHRESAESKNIAVRVAPPESLLEVRGDEIGVRTILDNLINNAIKYTPDGGQVSVAWRRDDKMVLLEVADTGIGIAPEDQDRVFERFFRVDKARSRELGGTGLGLSIVKHTALALGGRVGLESRLGRGSTFRVWLPEGNGRAAN